MTERRQRRGPRRPRREAAGPAAEQADPNAPLLVVEDLQTYFTLESGTVKAVDGVSFRSTTARRSGSPANPAAARRRRPCRSSGILPSNATIVEGSVKLMGIDLVPKSENALRRYRWREITIVFQGAMNALNPVRRVRDQIAEPIEERLGESRRRRGSGPASCSSWSGSRGRAAKAYPHELSGGMRQRAMIAMALACDPAIVIGDEPTTALDVMVQAQILRAARGPSRTSSACRCILITHDLSVIAETCDRVMIMYAGRVAEEGPVDEVFRPPRHPYTQKLLAAFPNIHADRRTLDVIPGSPPDLRDPPPGCRFAPRCAFAMAVCTEVVPPEVTFDGVRVACHLYPEGSDGVPVTDAGRPTPSASTTEVAEPMQPTTTLVRAVEGLEVHFPIWRRLIDSLPRPPARGRARRRRHRPDAPARRGPRPRRRIGQRQDDDRTGHRQARPTRPADGSTSRARTSATCGRSGELRDLSAAGPAHLPGPVRDAEPEADDLRLRRRTARRQRDRDGRRRAARVIAALEAAGLRPASDFAFRFPHELSGGQRQRVVIAGALVMDPEIIVADEPVSMLDVSIRTELLRLMLDLRVERGLTYLFITHDLSLAWVIADRIAVMYLGKIMEIGPAEAVIRSPRNPYTQALVSVSPSPDPPTPGDAGEADDPRGRDAGRRPHPDRLPVPPALPAGLRSMQGRGAAAVRRRRRSGGRVLAGRARAAGPRSAGGRRPSAARSRE